MCLGLFYFVRSATMLLAGNDLQFERLGEADLGGEITVDGHFLEDVEKFAAQIPVAVFARYRLRMFDYVVAPVDGIVHRSQQRDLLFDGNLYERLAEESHGPGINPIDA